MMRKTVMLTVVVVINAFFLFEAPLFAISQHVAEQNVLKFLTTGGDINVVDQHGRTPLVYAVIVNLSIVKNLVEKGANVNATDNNGKTVLMYAVEEDHINHDTLEIVKFLLEKEAAVNAADQNGKTALMYAVFTSLGIVKALVEKGAHVSATDNSRRTALSYALLKNKTDIIIYLQGKMGK